MASDNFSSETGEFGIWEWKSPEFEFYVLQSKNSFLSCLSNVKSGSTKLQHLIIKCDTENTIKRSLISSKTCSLYYGHCLSKRSFTKLKLMRWGKWDRKLDCSSKMFIPARSCKYLLSRGEYIASEASEICK